MRETIWSATSMASRSSAVCSAATVAAEQSALERLATAVADQIVSRLALYAQRGGRRPRSRQ